MVWSAGAIHLEHGGTSLSPGLLAFSPQKVICLSCCPKASPKRHDSPAFIKIHQKHVE